MKTPVIGILAHVDAGKTTLSEAMLYVSGSIRKQGRVDHGDAFLDTYALERARGITIFSKQAQLKIDNAEGDSEENAEITLLDTPGHVDFSAEMERTLQVLDYAILVISRADGVQSHTQTLWQLLERYHIPTFLFINKMDQPGADREALLEELRTRLDANCINFTITGTEEFNEAVATCEETVLEQYLETGIVSESEIKSLISRRKLFPCYFGSALLLEGVEDFLKGLCNYTNEKQYPQEFGAKVFKIVRDEQGNRLTYMKITGGNLLVKSLLQEEKVNQIRIYSGTKYETMTEVPAGTICAVTGLTKTRAGEGLGIEAASEQPILEPVLNYQVQLPDGCDTSVMLPKLRELEEEIPELHVVWNDVLKEIQVQIMGEIQIEILKSLIQERFQTQVEFGTGRIIYKETIADTVEGVGHFEPLKHYAEVHLILEPGERGSGMQFALRCSEDDLDKNWQRLIFTHLEEKIHLGALTGSAITDMKITVAAGRAHVKHTEGGDFRQATYRAVRQGLFQAESILLEPFYEFRLELPDTMIGRAMTDIELMCGRFETPFIEHGTAILTGHAPVATFQDYQKDVIAYTKGEGRVFCALSGYEPCHNAEEVIAAIGYDAEGDLENPASSVFCSHGAGILIPWYQVKEHMHVESVLEKARADETEMKSRPQSTAERNWHISTEEVDAILKRATNANKRDDSSEQRRMPEKKTTYIAPSGPTKVAKERKVIGEDYLLVDGYNVIYAWDDLKELATGNLEGARGSLMDTLCNYQAIRKCNLILVFDAYRVKGRDTEIMDYHNIHVVYTKEAETADRYIEKFAHDNVLKHRITVATSDGVEQVIIRGQGCQLMSARELKEEVERVNRETLEAFRASH